MENVLDLIRIFYYSILEYVFLEDIESLIGYSYNFEKKSQWFYGKCMVFVNY